jgi:glycosyltransferase involved in cell wall biosynthesis
VPGSASRPPEPLVSVLLCVCNGERFLREAVDSALSQTHPRLEVIAVDDGSTDGSALLLSALSDPRLRVIRQTNQGASATLAAGLRAARGTYLALLDQDDRWHPEFLAAHLELLEQHPETDLSFCWFRVINEAGSDVGLLSHRFRGTIDFQGLLADFVIGASSNVVARRAAVVRTGGPDPRLARYYDLDLCLRIALLRPDNVTAIPRDLMFYRRHSRQITRDLAGMQREWEQVLDQLRALAPDKVAAVESRARSNMNRYFARLAYEGGQHRQSLGFLAAGFRAQRAGFLRDRRNWLTGAACLAGLLLPAPLHLRLERWAGLRR